MTVRGLYNTDVAMAGIFLIESNYVSLLDIYIYIYIYIYVLFEC